MGLYNLEKIFRPRSVAVIGASEKQGSIGDTIMRNLVEGGFEGRIMPVNPKHESVHDLPCFPSVSEADASADLAVVATPIHTVPDIVRDCVKAGVGGAVVISAGGKETGAKGVKIEQEIEEEARKGGLRIVGPNCLGFISPGRKLNASFASHMPAKGNLAFISQSGAICTSILDHSLKEGIGFSTFVSIGSMLDVDFGDLIDFLGNEYQVQSILLYVESLTNVRKFMSAARAVSRIKPVLVLKAGRSAAGAKAAASHTGAMAGEDDVYDAAFKRAGCVRVNTIQELFDCAELLAKQPRPAGKRIAVITNAGGPGVMAADGLSQHGIEPAKLSDDTIESLNQVLPPAWSHGNPIDILGDASPERYSKAIEVCVKDKGLDGSLVLLSPQAMTDPTAVAQSIADNFKGSKYPIFAVWMGGVDVSEGLNILNEAGIPTFNFPERAIAAFMYLVEYADNLELLQQIPPRLSNELKFDRNRAKEIIERALEGGGKHTLSEVDSKAVLDAYGIPVSRTEVAESEDGAARLAEKIGYPLAMKIHSPDISHKTDVNGVQLKLRTEQGVRQAWRQIMESVEERRPDARVEGVTLQPMVGRGEYEILMGAKKDPNFGPVIMFGMGGVLTELIRDRAIGLPPMDRLLAQRLMEATKVHRLLQGYRGRPGADLESVEETIIRLSQLLVDFPQIAELDMNPVLISNSRPFAVDARIILEPTGEEPREHLVISPYPEEYEFRETTASGFEILIRPVQPEDAPLFKEMFQTLSSTSIYYRFFRYIKELTPDMLARFTQVDYDREIALVAIDESEGRDRMLGADRVISDPDGKNAEFAILVGDPWQGMGIGATLLSKSLRVAKDRGMEKIWGTVLPGNRQMLALGRKLGFDTKRYPDSNEFELSIDLREVSLEDLR
jgi:acetyltransferase